MIVVVAAGLALAALGCGEKTLDTDKVESEVRALLKGQTSGLASPSEIKSLTCPKDIKQKEGVNFNCKLGKDSIEVTQTNDDGALRLTGIEPPGY